MSNHPGILYIVATPIGNLEDISQRAIRVLSEVDVIAAEDTRHSGALLRHLNVSSPLVSLHEHNEERQVRSLIARLRNGDSIALISDAGTPLVSDPGYRLVRAAQDDAIQVVPVPGPSAVLAALSAAGLPTDRFAFEGFLPAKPAARRKRLEALTAEPRTLVFFESTHRIADSLADMAAIFGPEREAALAKELTKSFESIRRGPLRDLHAWLTAQAERSRGEFVVMIGGAEETAEDDGQQAERVVQILAAELPLKQAAALAAEITGVARNKLYRRALAQTRSEEG